MITENKTVSLCMIVKNEENYLDQCLKSVKDFVDEIIIVDTGSTDNTIAIANKYTQQVRHYNWNGDFSAARNYSLLQIFRPPLLLILRIKKQNR